MGRNGDGASQLPLAVFTLVANKNSDRRFRGTDPVNDPFGTRIHRLMNDKSDHPAVIDLRKLFLRHQRCGTHALTFKRGAKDHGLDGTVRMDHKQSPLP